LKKAAPVIYPGVRPKRLHLLVEEVRPRGIREALAAAALIGKEKAKFLEALEKIVTDTAARKIAPEAVKEAISR